MKRIPVIAGVLFVVAVPLFLFTAGITWAFNSPGVYHRGFQEYQVSLVTGITDADLRQVSADIRRYFNSRVEPLSVRAPVFGVEREIFSQREIGHMRDVKRLVWGVYIAGIVSGVYLLATVVLGLAFCRGSYLTVLARRGLWGGGLTLALILAVGMFALVGFDTLFLKFHQLSFSNDLWQLDPRKDYLVMLFPQNFWFDATMWVALRAVAGALVVTAACGGYLEYRYWSERKVVGRSIGRLDEP